MASGSAGWLDSPAKYGRVSRFFHWAMAALLLWQFTSAILRVVAKDTAVAGFFWSTHFSVGFSIFVLVWLRGIWGLYNYASGHRPSYAGIHFGRLAVLGHLVLYALMAMIPTMAIVRAYGSGRGFTPFGIEIFAATGERIPALMAPANAAHGLLGWLLLVLIVGHIMMSVLHRVVWKEDILSRMSAR
ncbi:cytochrome b [Aureimonas fodinaquatilis]|uniref:Cytochrome b n=1 Tax=Aureimonas fodinaquatilis TaxID=2565783 RepID=A0A5B0E187_9HYPH|nr:cytochrome b [Aureimonas fodinaquatilis]KAA0971731.1 cytochrome b [Aureimonas fodinaquatilis]